jgi:histidinol dehydrogenase
MKVLTYPSEEANARIAAIVNRTLSYSEDHERAVMEIIQAVQNEGDTALLRYTRQFDSPEITLEQIRVSEAEMEKGAKEVDSDFTALLQRAKGNISRYHEKQQRYSWFLPHEDGSFIGQMVRPVAAAGLYIPGGYTPSTGRQHQPVSACDRPVAGNQRYF